MTSSPRVHRSVATVAVLAGFALLGTSATGVRAMDAELATLKQDEAPVTLRSPDGPAPTTPASPAAVSDDRTTSTPRTVDCPEPRTGRRESSATGTRPTREL